MIQMNVRNDKERSRFNQGPGIQRTRGVKAQRVATEDIVEYWIDENPVPAQFNQDACVRDD